MTERISVLLLLLLPGFLRAEVFLYRPYTSGHVDIGPRIVDGQLAGFWKNDDATVDGAASAGDFAAEGIRALGVFDTAVPLRPAGAQWDFLGVAADEAVYILPASGIPSTVPYLGFSTEHTSVGHFEEFKFVLQSVTGPPGSTFALYTSSSNIPMHSGRPPHQNILSLETGEHLHFNWAFSHPGTYDLTFRFEAVQSGDVVMTGFDTFRFQITAGGGLEDFDHWRRTHFRPGQQDDPAISGPDADAGTATGHTLGFTNLQRFAFGGAPAVSFTHVEINTVLFPAVRLTLRKDSGGLETRPERATNLAAGDWTQMGLVEVESERERIHHDPGLERRLYRHDGPPLSGPLFFRAVAVITLD